METRKEITLKEFIDTNSHLLSAMAALTALFAFVGKLPISWLNSILSFLFIGGIVIVLIEINSNTPKEKERSWRLDLFHLVLLLGMWGTIAYWLLLYRTFWNMFLWVPLWVLLTFSYYSTTKEMVENLRFLAGLPRIKKILELPIAKKILNAINCILKPFIKAYKLIIILFSLISAIYFSIPINLILTGIDKFTH